MKFVNVNDATYDLLKGMSEELDVPIPKIIDDFILNGIADIMLTKLREEIDDINGKEQFEVSIEYA